MSKVHAIVEFNFGQLDDQSSKELARLQLESRGFTVASLRAPTVKGEGKTFIPKAGKPGSIIKRDGRAYQVWDDAPNRELWVVPVDRRPGDTEVYLTGAAAGSAIRPYHGDGKVCAPSVAVESGYHRVETPCPHWSHSIEQAS